MAEFNVRIALGNGTRGTNVRVTANNATDARKAAEGQTGGKAKGNHQVYSKPGSPKK